jgi:hypothetical protein
MQLDKKTNKEGRKENDLKICHVCVCVCVICHNIPSVCVPSASITMCLVSQIAASKLTVNIGTIAAE